MNDAALEEQTQTLSKLKIQNQGLQTQLYSVSTQLIRLQCLTQDIKTTEVTPVLTQNNRHRRSKPKIVSFHYYWTHEVMFHDGCTSHTCTRCVEE